MTDQTQTAATQRAAAEQRRRAEVAFCSWMTSR